MTLAQRIRLGLLCAKLKLENVFTTDKDYPKDPDPENWRTINGSHVHLTNGKIDGGAGGKFKANAWVGKKSHGHNSFFPQHQMTYKTSKPYKAASVSAQAGSAGASEAKTVAQLASKSKAASIGEAAQTSAIASMAEYMKKKKAEAAAPAAPPSAPPAPEPEEAAVPFGSPAPAPSTASEKPPIGIINTMKGTFKNSSKEVQTDVSNFLKSGDINELPVFPNGVDMLNDELCQKAYNAWKSKIITKTAAQNIVAKAVGNPNSLFVKLAAESWGDVPAPAAPAKTKTAKPKASKPATTESTMPKSDADAKAKEIISKMDSSPEHEHDTILEKVGLSSNEKEAVMLDYEMDMMNGSNNAEKTLKKILSKKDGTTAGQPSTPAVTYNDLSSSEKDVIDYVKSAVATGNTPEQIKKYYIPTVKQEFVEMAVALTKEYVKNPTATAQKDLHDKLAQIYKGKYKASKEDLAVWKAWKNGGTTAGGASTPSANFNPYDFSEAAVGWKLPKGTQMSFKDSNGADFKAYKTANETACKKMTKKQLAAVWRYTAGSTHLRDWLVYGKTDSWYTDSGNDTYKYGPMGWTNPYKNGMTGDALQKAADAISAGLKKVKHPDIIVNRNCSLMDWATADNPGGVTFKDLQDMAAIGEVFENKAFISATPLEKSVYGNSQARRHIFVPKKANGAFINSVSEYDHENEFLLDKNTKTRIIKVEKDKSGTIHVYEEVVLDD